MRRTQIPELTTHLATLQLATSELELERIISRSKEFASLDEAHNRWFLEMIYGKAGKQPRFAPSIGLPEISDLRGCAEALGCILAAQQDQTLTEESAAGLRRTVESMASTYRSLSAESLLTSLEESGSLPFYGPAAGGDKATKEAFAAFLAAQSESGPDAEDE